MKISKLFHWLYAILMFLPVFFIGGRTLYTIFNKNAYESYSVNYKTELVVTSNSSLFVSGSEYYINAPNTLESSSNMASFDFYFTNISWDLTKLPHYQTGINRIVYANSAYLNFYIDNTLLDSINRFTQYDGYFNTPYTITLKSTSATNVSYCYLIINQKDTLDNAFTYSVNEINDNPLFSWASTSFLVAPMSYIGNLFGLSASSPIITMLSYWLSISLIWLVFDLVMYVPLLVHRWIDKGIIE